MTEYEMAMESLAEAEAPVVLTAEKPLMDNTTLVCFPGVLPDGDTGNARFVKGALGLLYLGFSRKSTMDEIYKESR